MDYLEQYDSIIDFCIKVPNLTNTE